MASTIPTVSTRVTFTDTETYVVFEALTAAIETARKAVLTTTGERQRMAIVRRNALMTARIALSDAANV